LIFTNLISRAFGTFASKEFPKPIQIFINRSYVKLLRLDMSDFRSPEYYKSLNKLFTRKLEKNRSFSTSSEDFISPTDSKITSFGKINKNTALQIKGLEYSIPKLLDKEIDLNDGNFINFYLSPKDYHRYHIPYDLQILKIKHFSGKLYPVNFKYLNKMPELFIQNERVVLECKSENNKIIYIVLVGALNVGQMIINFEPRIETNIKYNSISEYQYKNLIVKKGDELGYFKMGSTVVILSEKDFLEPKLEIDQDVKFGETIAKVL
jgi:phosphatidylserine decarboxylase